MKRVFRAPLVILGAMLLLSGCGGGGGNNGGDIEDLDRQIFNAFQTWANAVENEDINTLDRIVSPAYLHRGTNKTGYLDALEDIFDDYNDIEVDIVIDDIDYDDEDTPFFAESLYSQYVTGVNRTTGQREVIDDEDRDMIWAYEDSRWKMYGNQSVQPGLQTPGANAAGIKKSPRQISPSLRHVK